MVITGLAYNKTFSDFMKVAMKRREYNLFHTFDHFAGQVEHYAEDLDFLIVDASYFTQPETRGIFRHLERSSVPMVVIDDKALNYQEIKPGRYPSNAIGVIFNEALADKSVATKLIDTIYTALENAPASSRLVPIQGHIREALEPFDQWGLNDPCFAEGYASLVPGQPA